MKILVAAAIVSVALVAPTLAMPIASQAPSAHADQAVVQAQYNHRGGGHGHHYGWGRGHHRGWGNSHHRY
jgi:opacity protein-like surface antigen